MLTLVARFLACCNGKAKRRSITMPPKADLTNTRQGGASETFEPHPAVRVQLPTVIDEDPAGKLTARKTDAEFWNSIMTERESGPSSRSAQTPSPHPLGSFPYDERPGIATTSHNEAAQSTQSLGSPGTYSCQVNDIELADLGADDREERGRSRYRESGMSTSPLNMQSDYRRAKAEAGASSNSVVALPATLTWNTALNCLLASGCLDIDTVGAIQQRVSENSPTAEPTLANTDLVPNFSRPIIAAPFYDRRISPVPHLSIPETDTILPNGPFHNFNEDDDTDDSLCTVPVSYEKKGKQKALPNGPIPPYPTDDDYETDDSLYTLPLSCKQKKQHKPLPNGPIPPSPPTTPLLHPRPIRPTGLPTSDELALLCPYEGTIATQARLIRDLHVEIDNLNAQLQHVKDEGKVAALKAMTDRLRKEIGVLKRAVNLGGRIVGSCWERERAIWVDLREMLERHCGGDRDSVCAWLGVRRRSRHSTSLELQRHRLDDEAEGFGSSAGGAVHIGCAELRRELEGIVEVAEQNLRVLQEDVTDLTEVILTCEEPGGEAEVASQNCRHGHHDP
ncbi:hypothetical protein M011DRAFT_523556 [Sporormia fimetaria CBS 119925]|uniref:Uncharacterized protein n=1 Tax=Sporormia fimetaria CBS 119925 TaxID=1340428 RepID=A0A6A6VIU9_9PLEO|nr:hypothetical protein M011DRAFT_523556 [Sporormia fimetaria CBS 119925]